MLISLKESVLFNINPLDPRQLWSRAPNLPYIQVLQSAVVQHSLSKHPSNFYNMQVCMTWGHRLRKDMWRQLEKISARDVQFRAMVQTLPMRRPPEASISWSTQILVHAHCSCTGHCLVTPLLLTFQVASQTNLWWKDPLEVTLSHPVFKAGSVKEGCSGPIDFFNIFKISQILVTWSSQPPLQWKYFS